jgi:hypothetical protein
MLLCCVSPIAAQQAVNSNADWQAWPEVTLSIRLNEKAAVVFYGTLHFGKNVSDLNEEQLGIALDFSLNKYFSLNSAYRHSSGQPPGRSHSQEDRFFLDFTARAPLGDGFRLSDRNRGELRHINGMNSGRYRNRLQLERLFKINGHSVTPYLADEVFYDGRYHLWNRNRLYTGVRVPLSEHLGVDGYYLAQSDVRDRPFKRRNVIGLALHFSY